MERVIRVGGGEDREAWRRALGDESWMAEARVLKQEGRSRVLRGRMMGREVVVKEWGLGGFAGLKALAGGSRGARHWRGARRLEAAGVRTARCYALARGGDGGKGGGGVERLVMEALPGGTLLEHMAQRRLPPARQRAIARQAGRLVGRLAAAGLFNRDHKPSNLIVMPGDDCGIAVIDCVAVRRWRWGRGGGEGRREGGPEGGVEGGVERGVARMLAAMAIEPLGCGCAPGGVEMARVVRACARELGVADARRFARRMFPRVARLVARHGDPRSRVDPLG